MNEENEMGESVKGAYSYHDDDGKEYSVTYTADENGFRPVSKNSICELNFDSFYPFQIWLIFF